ncbi:MAG: hypothetical protein CMM48_00140 [Rhodospirillaceae bacterium]|nr:hypothetical protein [Rhodospirillaceae bacterium]HAA92548.1 hypothetical protein [Rhodospirillaceae bacterium]
MRLASAVLFVIGLFCASSLSGQLIDAAEPNKSGKKRIFVVSSYHKEYLWSKSTQLGLSEAMLNYGYLDNSGQIEIFAAEDKIESSKAIVVKAWMDTKRRSDRNSMFESTRRIMATIKRFKPDLVMLGDDNATNFIGTQLLDTEIPVVFWGINGLPLKYGLVESMDNPGHNVTGVWQSGYHKESLEFLARVVPAAKTFAILASDSVTARASVKQLLGLADEGKLPLTLTDVVMTNSFDTFKKRARELEDKVDAFFILNHDTLRDASGAHVAMLDVGRWYLKNIRKPEAAHEDQFVNEGMLLTANDSGYNQSYRAFEMAFDILEQGLNPSRMRTVTPPRGPLMINRVRAAMLGIDIGKLPIKIDKIVEHALALEH